MDIEVLFCIVSVDIVHTDCVTICYLHSIWTSPHFIWRHPPFTCTFIYFLCCAIRDRPNCHNVTLTTNTSGKKAGSWFADIVCEKRQAWKCLLSFSDTWLKMHTFLMFLLCLFYVLRCSASILKHQTYILAELNAETTSWGKKKKFLRATWRRGFLLLTPQKSQGLFYDAAVVMWAMERKRGSRMSGWEYNWVKSIPSPASLFPLSLAHSHAVF